VVSVTPRPLFTPGKDPVPILQEAGWAPGPVWTGAENLAPLAFDPQTVQPVVSCYTDWATGPIIIRCRHNNYVHTACIIILKRNPVWILTNDEILICVTLTDGTIAVIVSIV
jgi:hypothetical protein